jgi:hypothetical protein
MEDFGGGAGSIDGGTEQEDLGYYCIRAQHGGRGLVEMARLEENALLQRKPACDMNLY